jgi:hypothetical protein
MKKLLAASSSGVVDVPYGGAGENFMLIEGWYRGTGGISVWAATR